MPTMLENFTDMEDDSDMFTSGVKPTYKVEYQTSESPMKPEYIKSCKDQKDGTLVYLPVELNSLGGGSLVQIAQRMSMQKV
jgi:hypothetical protein